MEKVIIVGAGGHGRVVIDAILLKSEVKIIGFLDDGEIQEINGIEKIGKLRDIEKFNGYKFHIAIGNNELRNKLSGIIEKKNLYTIIHPKSYISKDAKVGRGCYIGANVVINSQSKIEDLVIINTGSIIEHDCILEEGVHVSYGCLIGSNVKIQENIYIEMGSVIKRGEIVERDIV